MDDRMSWENVEKRFPEATVAWDRDGGPEWSHGRNVWIGVLVGRLTAWFNDGQWAGNHWGFYYEEERRWSFL